MINIDMEDIKLLVITICSTIPTFIVMTFASISTLPILIRIGLTFFALPIAVLCGVYIIIKFPKSY